MRKNYVKNTGKRKTLSVGVFDLSEQRLFTYIRVKYNTLFSGFRYLMDFHKKQEKFFLILPTILILPRQMCRLFFYFA